MGDFGKLELVDTLSHFCSKDFDHCPVRRRYRR